MDKKIDLAIEYYTSKGQKILDKVNKRNNVSADELIKLGEEMAIIEYKLTALEIAKTN
ncbi:hypothetical protein [Winogradskyella sp. KYW1333]|jgi:hypothetical protein|uniref:hypothetical protein n=1 Tax=unclassified Winogradskyella TaxID=2615021 RepID=UPI0015F119E2|nr:MULTISPECIES: hypothetical protein [unclassified Winogradskyella]MDA9885678.1 hypothetical protein [bacterium]MDB4752211.1 hypothetical protein [Winogradskyella sp.]